MVHALVGDQPTSYDDRSPVRRRLSPKALGLALVALVLMGVMTWLGLWQLSVYDDHQHSDAEAVLQQDPVPLSQVLGRDAAFPSDGVSRPVTVSGHYLVREQVYVLDLQGSSERYAVVTPLVTANGSAILVVRGSLGTLGAAAPAGAVTVEGVLEPSGARGGHLTSQRVTKGLSIPSLVSSIGPDLYSGYILQRTSTPAQAPALDPVSPPLPHPSRWAGIRNLVYACQWWLFAVFVAFMWWRMTGDLVDSRPAEVAPRSPADAESDSLYPLG